MHHLPPPLRPVVLLALATLACACTTPHPPTEVLRLIEDSTHAARIHQQAGEPIEAAELTNAVLGADPEYAPALELRDSLPSHLAALYGHRVLGANFARRIPTERPTWAKALLYLPDRFLDLFDVISVDFHAGGGAYVNYHVTRAAQVGIGLRAVSGVGWHERRSLGIKSQAQSEIVLVALGAEAYAGHVVGTSGIFAAVDTQAGLHRPSSPSYQQYRDYWGVGASATIAFLGFEYEFHPVQLADFAAGWALVDFLNDDFAVTRGLNLSRGERNWIQSLYELERSPEARPAYRRLREAPSDTSAPVTDEGQ